MVIHEQHSNRSGLGMGMGVRQKRPPFSQDVGGRAFQEAVGKCVTNSYKLLKQILTGEAPRFTFAKACCSKVVGGSTSRVAKAARSDSPDTREYVVSAMRQARTLEVLPKEQTGTEDLYGAIQRALASMSEE
jgi:hypothetical protein